MSSFVAETTTSDSRLLKQISVFGTAARRFTISQVGVRNWDTVAGKAMRPLRGLQSVSNGLIIVAHVFHLDIWAFVFTERPSEKRDVVEGEGLMGLVMRAQGCIEFQLDYMGPLRDSLVNSNLAHKGKRHLVELTK